MVAAVLISASFFIAGIGAYYLVKNRSSGFAKRSLSIALGVATIVLPFQLFIGDQVAGQELPLQLSKLEAMEGNWTSGNTRLGGVSSSPTSRRSATSRRSPSPAWAARSSKT